MPLDPFEIFMKREQANTRLHGTDIRARLGFDAHGAYLLLFDENDRLLQEANYLLFSGPARELVKHWAILQERQQFEVHWDNRPADVVYLHEHEYLMELLVRFGKLSLEKAPKEALRFEQEMRPLTLQAAWEEDEAGKPIRLAAHWRLGQRPTGLAVRPITERYLLIADAIVEVEPLGPYFQYLEAFSTSVPTSQANAFLSLFRSKFPQARLHIEDWNIATAQEPLAPKPTLIFEKIDADDSLYLRLDATLPFLPGNFLGTYDLDMVAQCKMEGKQVMFYPISYSDSQAGSVAAIEKLLKKHRKKAEGNYVLADASTFVMEKPLAAKFLLEELPALLESFEVMGAERLREYKISAVTPKLNLNLSSGIDFLEGDASLQFGEEQLSLGEVLRQFTQQRYVRLSDGTQVLMNQAYIDRLSRIFTRKKKGKKDGIEISFFDLPLVEEMLEERTAHKAIKRSRELFEGFNSLEKSRKRLPKVEAKLRPYQEKGVRWLLYLKEHGLGGCLADDMGLGKTLQTISLLSSSYPGTAKPSLLIMPRSLLYNWENEIRRFNPELSAYVFYGANRDWDEAMRHHLILTTYGLVRTQIETLLEKEFHYVVLDESQQIKNLQSQAHKAVVLLKAEHRLALSGTPIENNLGELYALFDFLNPAMFGGWERFNQSYLLPIQKYGDEQAAQDLRRKIYPFLLRRLKREVLKDLPPKVEQVLYVEMEDDHARLYEQRRQFYQNMVQAEIASQGLEKTQFLIFQALNELRQLASIPEAKTDGAVQSPKKEALAEQLAEAFANGHKALIFANFLAAVEEIGQVLEGMGIDYVSMTGATRNRQELVERFQEDSSCQAFVMTLKTGGTGLNLTAADMVFIYDPWWNVAAESQAIDRAHRIGQLHSVTAYKLIVRGTIEEKILQLQEQKRQLVEQVVATDGAALKALSPEDIDFILS